jgi:hypothetical protein
MLTCRPTAAEIRFSKSTKNKNSNRDENNVDDDDADEEEKVEEAKKKIFYISVNCNWVDAGGSSTFTNNT